MRRLAVTNKSVRPREIDVTSYAEIVLAPQADDRAHRDLGIALDMGEHARLGRGGSAWRLEPQHLLRAGVGHMLHDLGVFDEQGAAVVAARVATHGLVLGRRPFRRAR